MPVSANTALPPGESPTTTPDDGTIKVTVIGAKDLSLMGESSIKPYVLVKCGKDRFETRHAGKTVAPQWYVVLNTMPQPSLMSAPAQERVIFGTSWR